MLTSRGCFFIVFILIASSLNAQNQRAVAITIDDLPAGDAAHMSAATILEITRGIVGTLSAQKVPAIGFVNESKLYTPGEVDDRIKALSIWLDAGLELGNHTFSHASLNQVGLKAWEEEVIRGETVTRMLMAQHKMQLRYLRHPYLDVGRDLQTRREAEAFLTQRGYHIAPVTVDAWDWMYGGVYEDAKRRGDRALMDQLAKDYLSYSDTVFADCERLSKELVGYEPKQILLLHANQLEADHIGELIEVIRNRGYRFITLQEALGDQAYSLPDTYVGEEGPDWLDHWAVTRGKPAQGRPVFPQWVIEKSKAMARPATTVP